VRVYANEVGAVVAADVGYAGAVRAQIKLSYLKIYNI
jgi:hypothetical protein